MNQFFYTRRVITKNEQGEGESVTTFTDSFNLNKVIRSMELESGERIVVLDDLHERVDNVPDIDIKTNKMKGFKRERNTYQSEITLNKEDSERFYNISNIK